MKGAATKYFVATPFKIFNFSIWQQSNSHRVIYGIIKLKIELFYLTKKVLQIMFVTP